MGNILFVPSVSGSEWVATVLPGRSPAELPVTGRRLIDYALERVRRFGFNFAEVLDWSFSERLSADFEEDEHAGFHVYYHRGAGDVPRGLAALENPSFPLAGKVVDGLTVIWGPCITSGEPDEISVEPLPPEACVQTPMGIYRREGGRWMRVRPKGLAAKDVRSWRRINLAVLENPDAFTLPGYTAERDVHIGRNVVLERGTQVGRPVLLNDDVWCARNVRIDRDVIIGKGAFVGEGTHLLRTIVCDETYIGTGLEIVDKIVVGSRIIDAEAGSWIDLDEKGVVHRINPHGTGWMRKIVNFLYGRSRGKRD